jgi:hypothetical protein
MCLLNVAVDFQRTTLRYIPEDGRLQCIEVTSDSFSRRSELREVARVAGPHADVQPSHKLRVRVPSPDVWGGRRYWGGHIGQPEDELI